MSKINQYRIVSKWHNTYALLDWCILEIPARLRIGIRALGCFRFHEFYEIISTYVRQLQVLYKVRVVMHEGLQEERLIPVP